MSTLTLTINIGRRTVAFALLVLLAGVTIWFGPRGEAGITPPGEGIARVYVAVGTGFADALGVGPAAALNGAPVILVPTNPPLMSATENELIRLDPREVVIIGGTAAISTETEDALEALLPEAHFSRIAGSNRYITNALLSQSAFPAEGWLAIPAVAFTATTPDTAGAQFTELYAYNSSSGDFYAQVHLPQGAHILELRAEVRDSVSDGAVTVDLHRYSSSVVTEVASVATDIAEMPGTTVISTTAIASGLEVVDNETGAYIIEVTGAYGGYLETAVNMVMIRYRIGSGG